MRTPRRAANPGFQLKFCQEPTRRMAVRRTILTWRSPASSLSLARKLSQSRPFVLVLLILVARVCGYVDALEAVTTATQKEPFLMDADPTSHRVRLWQGGSAPILGGCQWCLSQWTLLGP